MTETTQALNPPFPPGTRVRTTKDTYADGILMVPAGSTGTVATFQPTEIPSLPYVVLVTLDEYPPPPGSVWGFNPQYLEAFDAAKPVPVKDFEAGPLSDPDAPIPYDITDLGKGVLDAPESDEARLVAAYQGGALDTLDHLQHHLQEEKDLVVIGMKTYPQIQERFEGYLEALNTFDAMIKHVRSHG